jgi:hypothetical protein
VTLPLAFRRAFIHFSMHQPAHFGDDIAAHATRQPNDAKRAERLGTHRTPWLDSPSASWPKTPFIPPLKPFRPGPLSMFFFDAIIMP